MYCVCNDLGYYLSLFKLKRDIRWFFNSGRFFVFYSVVILIEFLELVNVL